MSKKLNKNEKIGPIVAKKTSGKTELESSLPINYLCPKGHQLTTESASPSVVFCQRCNDFWDISPHAGYQFCPECKRITSTKDKYGNPEMAPLASCGLNCPGKEEGGSEKTLYYAHSMKVYNTRKETKELKLIKNSFPGYKLINPADYDKKWEGLSGKEIMEECFEIIRKADIIVFSAIEVDRSLYVGRGVFEEIDLAEDLKKEIYFINKSQLTRDYELSFWDENDWVLKYGLVEPLNHIYIVDTETTGLDGCPWDHIVEIAIVKVDIDSGKIEKVYDTLIKYDTDQWSEKHQEAWIFCNSDITIEMVKNATKELEIAVVEVNTILKGRKTTSYNRFFDFNQFLYSRPWAIDTNIEERCIMDATTYLFKRPKEWDYGYLWVSLVDSINRLNLAEFKKINPGLCEEVEKLGSHRALYDCFHAACVMLKLHEMDAYFKHNKRNWEVIDGYDRVKHSTRLRTQAKKYIEQFKPRRQKREGEKWWTARKIKEEK